jgi:hypothetical protein
VTGAKTPIPVLADANILVKDVVSNVLYDLHVAGHIQLHWTPEIEAEYIRHRARLRAEGQLRDTSDADLIWAARRIEIIKTNLVKAPAPPGWIEEESVAAMSADARYAALLALPDVDDRHVALAAARLAEGLGRAIVLTTDNLDDLPRDTLLPFSVAVMHQGELLDLLRERDLAALSDSILKTAADFTNPPITPAMMLRSISSRNQFWNPDLAEELGEVWNVAPEGSQDASKAKGKALGPRR